ncbi:hypothetical protein N9S67_02465, partial [Candidatus Pelagibacter sp.]|nr:hypothetical protein [Candidatus Pelagibacter sp.]
FKDLIKNNKDRWRYINGFLSQFYYLKYQKSLINIDKYSSKFFTNEEWTHFKNTSAFSPQNIYLSFEENKKLVEKFKNYNKNFAVPDIIIVDKRSPTTQNIKIDKKYCKNNIDNFNFYQLSENNSCS